MKKNILTFILASYLVFFTTNISLAAVTVTGDDGFNTTTGTTSDTQTQQDDTSTPTVDVRDSSNFNLGNTNLTDQLNPSSYFGNQGINSNEKYIEGGIVPTECQTGQCGFSQLVTMINTIGKWSMLLTTTAATIMFVYAGFLYITAQGDQNKVKQATTIFRNVAVGFVIILTAYLVVKELLVKLGLDYLAKFIN